MAKIATPAFKNPHQKKKYSAMSSAEKNNLIDASVAAMGKMHKEMMPKKAMMKKMAGADRSK